MAKIRMIVIEGEMSVDDVQRLARGFAADDAAFTSITMPSGVTAQAATLNKQEEAPRPRPVSVPLTDAELGPPETPSPNFSAAHNEMLRRRAAERSNVVPVVTPPAPAPAPVALPVELPPAIAKVFPEAVVETEEQTNASSLVADLVACKRLSGVIERLQREGHTDTASLIAACKTHRDSVPLLQRLGEGLEDRVTRTLEGMK